MKTVAMRESKDLNKVEMHYLFADLKAYEFKLGIGTKEDPSNPQPTKSLVVTTSTPTANAESSSRKSSDQINNEAMSLFVKNLKIL